MDTPIICVVGRSDAGKTTLLEKIVAELRSRGYRVGTIKHDVHGFDIDHEGKDSYRLFHAGSEATAILSPQKTALVRREAEEMSLRAAATSFMPGYDLVLAEGFKRQDRPKIEIVRSEIGTEPLCGPKGDGLVAFVSDVEMPGYDVPRFGLDDVGGICDFLVETFIKRQEQADVWAGLVVNGKRIPMKGFVQDFVARTVLGMVTALKGVAEPSEIEIKVRRKD